MSESTVEQKGSLSVDSKCPKAAATAAMIWIVIGVVVILMSIFGFTTSDRATGLPGLIGIAVVVLFSAVFIQQGRQTLKATAKDTQGNGVASIIFGLLCGGSVALALTPPAKGPHVVDWIKVGYFSASGVALLAAGVLAMIGRGQYMAWKKAREDADRQQVAAEWNGPVAKGDA